MGINNNRERRILSCQIVKANANAFYFFCFFAEIVKSMKECVSSGRAPPVNYSNIQVLSTWLQYYGGDSTIEDI